MAPAHLVIDGLKRYNDERMFQALRELMKEEIADATKDTMLDNIRKLMKNMKLTAEQVMNTLEIPVSDQAKYSAML